MTSAGTEPERQGAHGRVSMVGAVPLPDEPPTAMELFRGMLFAPIGLVIGAIAHASVFDGAFGSAVSHALRIPFQKGAMMLAGALAAAAWVVVGTVASRGDSPQTPLFHLGAGAVAAAVLGVLYLSQVGWHSIGFAPTQAVLGAPFIVGTMTAVLISRRRRARRLEAVRRPPPGTVVLHRFPTGLAAPGRAAVAAGCNNARIREST
jgi:hypothetical protein